MSLPRRHWNRLVILGAVALCAFGILAGRRCGRAAAPGPRPRVTARVPGPRVAPFACRVLGRVVDEQGRPVAGAEVVLALRSPFGRAVPVLLVPSGPHGRLRAPVVLPGTYHLLVSAPGRARFHRRLRLETPGDRDLGDLRLQPGFEVQGRVVDPAGAPIPHAEVSAIGALDLPGRPLEPALVGQVDGQGRFRIRGLRATAYQVRVRAHGFGSAVLRHVVAPAVALRVTLRPLLRLSGRVKAGDEPAPGATVELAGSGVWPPIHTKTDGQGRFHFDGVREGIYELRARRGRWVSEPAPAVDLLGGQPPPPVVLTLVRGTVLRGRVLDADTRQPLGGVRVTAGLDLLSVSPRMAQTTADGSFVLEPLLPGEYQLTLTRDEYLPRQGVAVTVLPGPNPPVELTLHRGGILAGTVIDDTGRPVVGAHIEVVGRARGSYIADRSGPTVALEDALWDRAQRVSADGTPAVVYTSALPTGSLGVMAGPLPPVPVLGSPADLAVSAGQVPLVGRAAAFVTDEKGRFRLTGVPPGSLSLVVRHESYVRAKAGPWRIRRGERRADLLIRMKPGALLAGTVLDAVGAPVAGVLVIAANPADPFQQGMRFTDDQGQFRLPHLEGRVRLELSAPGFVPLVHHVRVADGPQPTRAVLTLSRADCELRGRVVDTHGLAVAGARLTLVSVTPDAPSRGVALADDQGGFAVRGLGRITYAVTVLHDGFPDHDFEVRCPREPFVWKLAYGGGVAFEVRDRKTGEPVAAFQYVLRRAGGPVIRRQGFAGRARELRLRAGRYELEVTATRYARVTRTMRIPAGDGPRRVTRRGLVISLELAGSVEGYVRDDRGLAVEDALVKVAGQQGRTDAKGAFVITDVPPGTHALTASHPERGTGTLAGVTVRAGLATASLVIDLQPGTADAKAVRAGVPITLKARGNRLVIATVTPKSSAERAGLVSGDEVVSVDGRDLDGLGVGDAEALLRGPTGTAVVLELARDGKTFKRSVTRELLQGEE